MTATQRAQVVAAAAFLGAVTLFLPFVSYPEGAGGMDATSFMPLPFVVHMPLVLLGALMAARLAGRRDPLPLGILDRALSVLVAAYAVVALFAMWIAGNVFDDSSGVTPGIGFWGALVAAALIGGVSLMDDTAVHPAPAPAFEPTWVALRDPMELADGRALDPGVWYLAVTEAPEGLVLRLDDGTAALVPHQAVLPAPARVTG